MRYDNFNYLVGYFYLFIFFFCVVGIHAVNLAEIQTCLWSNCKGACPYVSIARWPECGTQQELSKWCAKTMITGQ